MTQTIEWKIFEGSYLVGIVISREFIPRLNGTAGIYRVEGKDEKDNVILRKGLYGYTIDGLRKKIEKLSNINFNSPRVKYREIEESDSPYDFKSSFAEALKTFEHQK